MEYTGPQSLDIASKPKVLLITHRTPYPPDKGDRIRSYHLLRFLAKRARVHLATLADEPITQDTKAALEVLAEQVAIVMVKPCGRWLHAASSLIKGRSATEGLFYSRHLQRCIRRWTAHNTYTAVVIVCSSMAQYLSIPKSHGTCKIVDLVDVDSQKWFEYASSTRGLRKLLYHLEGCRVRRLEASLPQHCDTISVVTEAEASCFQDFQADAPISIVSNGVDLEYFYPARTEAALADSCVFVGAMDYKPNIDAVQWFSDLVWPAVLRIHPKATLVIVGRRPTKAIRRLQNRPGIRVEADVADVRPYLWKSRVVVVPLRIARGVQNKILEAMAAGRPVLATSQALTGLPAIPGEHVILAESVSDWTAAVGQLFDNNALCRQLGMAARCYVEQHHNWDLCLEPFESFLDQSWRRIAS
ncbi:MAG: TIGR03087 family PEP-CTERM/XrtA system glycosyltransferase [Pirellulales bacterium]|nr:TIGR03087 family PEP-CTERM/XrtA system glycosyltransferase [Pirellulales bacterium]